MLYERYQPTTIRESFYQQPQRRPNALQEQVRASLSDPMTAEALLDRSRPLPDWMSRNLEQALNEYKKVYLGLYDYRYGLTGDMPMRRW